MIHIIGGGLAGSEAAWQAAERGAPVVLHEMRPVRPTAVHKTDRLAELVCSNSFRGDKIDNAVGLLKEEMRRLGSLVMRVADACRVPAGAALAVDRDRFAEGVTAAVASHPLITIVREEVDRIPPPGSGTLPVIIASGPLTAPALSEDIRAFVGSDHLYFYDAISPIVLAESIDRTKVFRASRWGRSLGPAPHVASSSRRATDGASAVELDDESAGRACGAEAAAGAGDGDYLNCPFDRAEYERFYDALVHAESATVHDFDNTKFFEGCLPIEVMAHRGADTLRFGPMKPVGLIDPRTGRQAYAIVQLRQDTLAGDHYSLVGFQTQIKWGDQARVLRLVPGLEQAEFVRLGMVHRNTYINGPTVLRETWQTRAREDVFFAGQVSGVEGYVESAASGLIAGANAAALVQGRPPLIAPRTTAIGALAYYVSHADPRNYQPSNIAFGLIEPLPQPPRDKLRRKLQTAERALRDLDLWMADAWPLSRAAGTEAGPTVGSAGVPAGGSVQRLMNRPVRRSSSDRPKDPAMTGHLRAFLEHLRLNRNMSAHTVRAYDSDLTQVVDFLAAHLGRSRKDLQPADLDHHAVRAFLGKVYKTGGSKATAARKLAALRTFTRYLRREDAIASDPVALAGSPKVEQKIPAHMSIEEMERLLATPDMEQPLGRRDRAILELFYASGLRLSELVGLDLDDVNLSARVVRVLGKGRKERIIPFNRTTADVVRTYLRDRQLLRSSNRGQGDKGTGGRGDGGQLGAVRGNRCSSTHAGGASAGEASIDCCGDTCSGAARAPTSARTRFATRLRRTCSSAAPTCARFRNCSAMRSSPPRSATRT